MKNYKPTSLADQVFDRLENDIIQGVYPKGEILTELKLVEQLGVSRTPIREALRRLEQEHIIEITPRGILVLGVSRQDLADILEIRIRIEGLAARLAAERITDEELEQMERMLVATVDAFEHNKSSSLLCHGVLPS